MPSVSFSGVSSRGPFWRQIVRGLKVQTCRRPRRRPIKEGDLLKLYWKQRVPKEKKPVHFIGYALCTGVERLRYRDFAYDDEFARRDGFGDSAELREWFGDPEIYGDTEYDVIHFKYLGEKVCRGRELKIPRHLDGRAEGSPREK